jgi:hypothetical protein
LLFIFCLALLSDVSSISPNSSSSPPGGII